MSNTKGVIDENALSQETLISRLATTAQAVMEGEDHTKTESLQDLLDCFTAKVVNAAFGIFREEYDKITRLLRTAYGRIASLIQGDFRKHASFYLGQLHALTEITYRLGQHRAPREAVELAVRRPDALKILKKVIEEKSIGAGALAKSVCLEDPNLSTLCKLLVERELLRRDRFGKRVRYSPTPLTFAVIGALEDNAAQNSNQSQQEPTNSRENAVSQMPTSRHAAPLVANAAQPPQVSSLSSGANDFVSGLLTIAAVQGAKGMVIEPNGQRVRLEGAKKSILSKLDLPLSVGKVVSEACSKLEGQEAFNWNGQKIKLVDNPAKRSMRLKFMENPDPEASKLKARAEFQKIQSWKEFEKVYLRAVMEACEWRKPQAADMLGIDNPQLDSILKTQNISQAG